MLALRGKTWLSEACDQRTIPAYSSSAERRISLLCFSRRSSRWRLSWNFFDGSIGARGRGSSFSFSIVSLSLFFVGIRLIIAAALRIARFCGARLEGLQNRHAKIIRLNHSLAQRAGAYSPGRGRAARGDGAGP